MRCEERWAERVGDSSGVGGAWRISEHRRGKISFAQVSVALISHAMLMGGVRREKAASKQLHPRQLALNFHALAVPRGRAAADWLPLADPYEAPFEGSEYRRRVLHHALHAPSANTAHLGRAPKREPRLTRARDEIEAAPRPPCTATALGQGEPPAALEPPRTHSGFPTASEALWW